MSINYKFVLDYARQLAGHDRPVMLDFGCGSGPVVKMGLDRGLTIYGADTYAGMHEAYQDNVRDSGEKALQDHIKRIENGRIPFEDNTFDVVTTNMVFEHVADPLPSLREIKRVLKPGGVFLALFPVRETAWEGHVKLWFPHWMKACPAVQIPYLRLMHKLGFGSKSEKYTKGDFAQNVRTYLNDYTFYHPICFVEAWWNDVFGAAPERHEISHMIYRYPKLKTLAGIPGMGFLLRKLCVTRACAVLVNRKQG